MAIEARKIIESQLIFDMLYTKYMGVYNALLSQGKISAPSLNFEIFKDQADFDGTINVPVYAAEDDAQKKNYGIFRFIGGTVDPAQTMNVYLQRFAFEMLSFEEYRDDIRNIMTTFASSIDARIFQLADGDDLFSVSVTVTEFPTMSETLDANGADKFISSIIIDLLIYEDLVHADGIVFKINNVRVPYRRISFNRMMIEPVPDLEKSLENKYIPTKTTEEISLSGLYKNDAGVSRLVDWLLDENFLNTPVRVFYADGIKVKTGVYMISSSNLSIDEGQLLAYGAKLLPYYNLAITHRGVLVKNGLGTGEYAIGDVVTISTDSEGFISWELETLQQLEFLEDTTIESPVAKFTMPDTNVIIKANKEG